jgi:hypothetical protein
MEAAVVFLFEDHFLPKRANIAQTQGHQLAPTSDGVLSEMTALNSLPEEVDQISEGNILRWMKQMALRGKGRIFDDQGICGAQKVVITGGSGSLERLCLHKDRMFPGAKLNVSRPGGTLWGDTKLERLLVYLADATLPDEVDTVSLKEAIGIDWRSTAKDIINDDTRAMLQSLGWTYESLRGRGGRSFFRRISSEAAKVDQCRATKTDPVEEI